MALRIMLSKKDEFRPEMMGIHQVKIVEVQEGNIGEIDTLNIRVNYIDDNKDIFIKLILPRVTKKSTEEQIRAANKVITPFLDAFRIKEFLWGCDYSQWENKIGYIKLFYDKDKIPGLTFKIPSWQIEKYTESYFSKRRIEKYKKEYEEELRRLQNV